MSNESKLNLEFLVAKFNSIAQGGPFGTVPKKDIQMIGEELFTLIKDLDKSNKTKQEHIDTINKQWKNEIDRRQHLLYSIRMAPCGGRRVIHRFWKYRIRTGYACVYDRNSSSGTCDCWKRKALMERDKSINKGT